MECVDINMARNVKGPQLEKDITGNIHCKNSTLALTTTVHWSSERCTDSDNFLISFVMPFFSGILKDADLSKLSSKTVRKSLEDLYKTDLTDR